MEKKKGKKKRVSLRERRWNNAFFKLERKGKKDTSKKKGGKRTRFYRAIPIARREE